MGGAVKTAPSFFYVLCEFCDNYAMACAVFYAIFIWGVNARVNLIKCRLRFIVSCEISDSPQNFFANRKIPIAYGEAIVSSLTLVVVKAFLFA